MYIRIENLVYDITDFDHPGGKVIQTHAWTEENNIDATNAFYQFHNRSLKAFKILKTLPSFPTKLPRDDIEREFRVIVSKLKKDGYFDPSWRHIVYRISLNILIWVFGLILLNYRWMISSITIMSIAFMQCGWIQHECGHNSFTCIPQIDRILQIIYVNVFMGGNYRFWNDQHFSHHANTQDIRYDKDLKTHPLVAFNEKLVQKKGHTWFTKHQHILYWWIINPIVWFTWAFLSYPMFALKHNHFREYMITRVSSFILYHNFFKFSNIISPWNTFILFNVVSLFGTMLLLATFTVSHTTTDSYNKHKGWVRPSSEHTINIPDHWLTNTWMGYLNFQIEHHLFPTMPQFRQNIVGKYYIRPFFEKHKIPYNEVSFWRANYDVYLNLKKISEY